MWKWIFYPEKIFRNPRRSEILIFDAEGEELLLEYVGKWSTEVLHLRSEKLNIPVLIRSMLRKGSFFKNYINEYIATVSPKVVITFIDNNPLFYYLKKTNDFTKFIAIQNGKRDSLLFDKLSELNSPECFATIDYLFCFGRGVSSEYSKQIHAQVIPIGSLKNNYVNPISSDKKSIVFISEYAANEGADLVLGDQVYSYELLWKKPDRIVLHYLIKYCEERNIVLRIALRSKTYNEKLYFKSLISTSNVKVEMVEPSGVYGSYALCDTANVVVTIESTLGYEAAARGNKTAFFTLRGTFSGRSDRTFSWPGALQAEGPFWTHLPESLAFERILDHLFAISDEEWKVELKKYAFEDIMTYDYDNATLKSVLRKELSESSMLHQ